MLGKTEHCANTNIKHTRFTKTGVGGVNLFFYSFSTLLHWRGHYGEKYFIHSPFSSSHIGDAFRGLEVWVGWENKFSRFFFCGSCYYKQFIISRLVWFGFWWFYCYGVFGIREKGKGGHGMVWHG